MLSAADGGGGAAAAVLLAVAIAVAAVGLRFGDPKRNLNGQHSAPTLHELSNIAKSYVYRVATFNRPGAIGAEYIACNAPSDVAVNEKVDGLSHRASDRFCFTPNASAPVHYVKRNEITAQPANRQRTSGQGRAGQDMTAVYIQIGPFSALI